MPSDSVRFRGSTPEARHLEVAGVRWDYWVTGQGPHGLLVLGGASSFGDTNHRLLTLFERSRRVVSPSYPHVRSAAELVDGLVALLDREGLRTVDVVGHGLGAAVAHLLIRKVPHRVDRLALSGFGLYSRLHLAVLRLAWWCLQWLPGAAVRRVAGRPLRRLAAQAGSRKGDEVSAQVEALLARHTRSSLLAPRALLRELFAHPRAYRLREPVARPGRVHLMFNPHDRRFSVREQHALAATYPGAIVNHFTAGGSLIGVTRADEFERKLEFFLRLEPAAATPPARGLP